MGRFSVLVTIPLLHQMQIRLGGCIGWKMLAVQITWWKIIRTTRKLWVIIIFSLKIGDTFDQFQSSNLFFFLLNIVYRIGAYLGDAVRSVETCHFLTPGVCVFFSHLWVGLVDQCTLCTTKKLKCKNGPSVRAQQYRYRV